MMKYIALIFLFSAAFYVARTQNIVASTPARLQVFAMKPDGSQVKMTSEDLSITYDQLKMSGELMLNSLLTEDTLMRSLLDSAVIDRILFSGTIPEQQFAFQSQDDVKFSVETKVNFGEQQSSIMIDFDVSNRNTSLANTFDISCSGSISLSNNLGITRDTGLTDQISFQFFQNVQTRTY
jgi:hypothetical protein